MKLHTCWQPFRPWAYAEDEKDVNEKSAAGVHLIRCGLLTRKYAADDTAAYCYSLNAKDKNGVIEKLYETQGWEFVCRHGGWIWYRKKRIEGAPESAYTFYAPENRNAIPDHLHEIIRPLDVIRNLLLILAVIGILIPSELTSDWTPRIAALPIFLTIPIVTYAERIRKQLGEDHRK